MNEEVRSLVTKKNLTRERACIDQNFPSLKIHQTTKTE